MNQYLVVQDEQNVYIGRESRIIQQLAAGENIRVYLINTTTEPPTLREAVLGDREDIVATVVLRDLKVDGQIVAEAQVQENKVAEDQTA